MVDLYESFSRGRAAGEQRRRQSTLERYFQGATQGDANALSQVYQADPSAGMQAQKFAREQQDDDMQTVVRAAQVYSQTRSPQAWAFVHSKLSTRPEFAGMPADLSTPENQEGSLKFASALVNSFGGGNNELAPRVVGDALVDSQGRVLYKAPPQQDYEWSERAGAWIPKPTNSLFEDGTPAPAASMTGADGAPVAIDPNMPPEDIAAVKAMEGGQVPRGFEAQVTPGIRPPPGLRAIPVAGVGPKQEAAPSGYRYKPDGSLEAIPGGPADQSNKPPSAQQVKLQNMQRKERAMLDSTVVGIDDTIGLIDKILAERKNFYGVTGAGGLLRNVPGSPFADIDAMLETLRGRSAFGALQEMRANSPTGGALGSVTERELALLQSAETQLQNSQSPGALERALKDYKRKLMDSRNRMRQGFDSFYQEQNPAATMTPASSDEDDALIRKYLGP
jgi:hypothetical protein